MLFQNGHSGEAHDYNKFGGGSNLSMFRGNETINSGNRHSKMKSGGVRANLQKLWNILLGNTNPSGYGTQKTACYRNDDHVNDECFVRNEGRNIAGDSRKLVDRPLSFKRWKNSETVMMLIGRKYTR